MAPNSETDEGNESNDIASSDPLTEETTAIKTLCLNSSTGTLTSPPLPTLPFELVTEILARLPVKFLMQFQCISKSWKSLISDPNFAKKHLRVSTTRPHLIFINRSSKFYLTAYPLSSFFTEVTLTATSMQLEYPLNNRYNMDFIVCNGILCSLLDQNFVFLWNPSIRKFTTLPSLENPRLKSSCTTYGFGYDHCSDSYKVVVVYCYDFVDGVCKSIVKVYTLGTYSWRRIQDFPFGVPSIESSGKLVSGTINWLVSTNSYSSFVIVSLDLEKESYQELLLPDYGVVDDVTFALGVLRDCLCMIFQYDTFTQYYTFSDVWLMKEYGNKDSWTKLFRLPYMEGFGNCPSIKALYVFEDGQVLMKYYTELVVYNSRDGTFKTRKIQNNDDWMQMEVYQESLISPCS